MNKISIFPARSMLFLFYYMEKEIWKNIVGYENLYKVSNMGNVFSCIKNIYRKNVIRNGYLSVKIKNKMYDIHRLVAIHFIENRDKKLTVNHINGNKHDNRVENLEWCTNQENINHYHTGDKNVRVIKKEKIKKGFWKISIEQYDKDMNFIKKWYSIESIKRHYNLKRFSISSVFNKYTNYVCGFYWKK